MLIGELAERAGTSTRTLRYYGALCGIARAKLAGWRHGHGRCYRFGWNG
ncbi:MerR family DNA-binding transcriptional regulator [Micromonospora sp. NBC_01638]